MTGEKMKSKHSFQIAAPVESVLKMLSAEAWLSFVPDDGGLEAKDSNWPDEGSSIVVRFGRRLGFSERVSVVEHEWGHRFRTHEEAYGGLYIDNVDLSFQEEDGATNLTFVRDVTSKSLLVRTLLFLMYPLRWITMAKVKERIEAMMKGAVALAGKKDADNGDYAEGYGGGIK